MVGETVGFFEFLGFIIDVWGVDLMISHDDFEQEDRGVRINLRDICSNTGLDELKIS